MNRNVSINQLKQFELFKDEFLQDILNELSLGHIWVVKELPVENRNNRNIMEPLLYAVKHDFNTFEVFLHCGESIQRDESIAIEVLLSEPNLFEGTVLSNDKDFLLRNVTICPNLEQYISPNLKNDKAFIDELNNVKEKNVDATLQLAILFINNPELRSDKEYISEILEKDVSVLKYISEELKNDYDFLREQSKKNEQIIDYVVDNVNEFGLDGIKAVRDTSKDFTIDDCLSIIDQMSETSGDERYAKVRAKVLEKGIDDVHVMRWVTAMVAQNDDLDPELVKKVLNYSMLTMEKTKKDLTEDRKMKVNLDNTQELITPLIINRLREKIEQKGVSLDEDVKMKIEGYEEFYKGYYEDFKIQKKKNVRRDEITKVTSEVCVSEIKKAMQTISNEFGKTKDESTKDEI